MSETKKPPMLHKPVLEKTAEAARNRCSDTVEADDPRFKMKDTPWGPALTFVGDARDIIHYPPRRNRQCRL